MASGDFADLQLQLAYLSGRSAVAQLDAGDLALAKQCINEAYLDCYINPGGSRPGWALQAFGIRLRAMLNPVVNVTLGSRTVTGYTFPTDMVGSTIQIGANYYTYAGLEGGVEKLVEPCQEATGQYTANFWHNSYPLETQIVEVENAPVVLGWGILSPMNSRAEQWKWKTILYADFSPPAGGGGVYASGVWPGGINDPVGTPIYYRIENGPMVTSNAIKGFFIVEPMPLQIVTINMQGWIVPVELSADADVPVLPANLSTRVLIPLVRERWALIYKKYTGGNADSLVAMANKAREILSLTSRGQRDRPVRNFMRNI